MSFTEVLSTCVPLINVVVVVVNVPVHAFFGIEAGKVKTFDVPAVW